MALQSIDLFRRSVLLVCDQCGRVLMPDGGISPRLHEDCDADELAALYGYPEEIRAPAHLGKWVEHNGRWLCPTCF